MAHKGRLDVKTSNSSQRGQKPVKRQKTNQKLLQYAPSLALSGSRPPLGDYFCGCLHGLRPQAQRSVKPQTTPPRSPYRAPVPRWGITLLFALVAEDASAAQRKTADHAPSLALTGSRPPKGDYLAPGVPPPTIARVYHGNVNAIH